METIELNGKKYISFEEYELLEKKLNSEVKDVKELIPKITLESYVPDESNVLGIGTCELIQGKWNKVILSTKEIKRIIKGLESFSISKDGLDSVHLIWAKDSPAIFGKITKNKENKYFASGFILAPRIEEI